MKKITWTFLISLMFVGNLYAEEYSTEIAKNELETALNNYTSCTESCASELGNMIFSKAPSVVLTAFGVMKGSESDNPNSIKVLSWIAFLQYVHNTGKTIVNENAACYQSCDKLNDDIVRLGRAGLLGPMLKGNNIDVDALSSSEAFSSYLKFVKPIQLPAVHRDEKWWKELQSTG